MSEETKRIDQEPTATELCDQDLDEVAGGTVGEGIGGVGFGPGEEAKPRPIRRLVLPAGAIIVAPFFAALHLIG